MTSFDNLDYHIKKHVALKTVLVILILYLTESGNRYWLLFKIDLFYFWQSFSLEEYYDEWFEVEIAEIRRWSICTVTRWQMHRGKRPVRCVKCLRWCGKKWLLFQVMLNRWKFQFFCNISNNFKQNPRAIFSFQVFLLLCMLWEGQFTNGDKKACL